MGIWMHACMDGYMDACMHGRMDTCLHVNGCMCVRVDVLAGEWTGGEIIG